MYTDKRDIFGTEPMRDAWPLWVQIAFGVMVGVLAANAIELVIAAQYARWQVGEVAQALQRSTAKAEAEAQRAREAMAVAQAARAEHTASAEQARIEQEASRQREAEEARRAAAHEVDRREEAWRRFYRPTPGCVGTVVSVQCANEHIRAKREFEERYSSGRL